MHAATPARRVRATASRSGDLDLEAADSAHRGGTWLKCWFPREELGAEMRRMDS